jgi:co-chaperonin GroES (HSP10)
MSNIGVHDFAIPHGHVRPTRDVIVIRLPMPPKMIGGIHVPDVVRDMAQHNVMAGRIVSMGPLAFVYKDAEGSLTREPVQVGDWVTIRPFAGTMVQGGKLQASSGWRYVSSFQDVLAVIPADKMPDPATLLWDDEDAIKSVAPAHTSEDFGGKPRERTVIHARS